MGLWMKVVAISVAIAIVAYCYMPDNSSAINEPKTFSIGDYINFGYFTKDDYYQFAVLTFVFIVAICSCTFACKVAWSRGLCSRVRPAPSNRRIIFQQHWRKTFQSQIFKVLVRDKLYRERCKSEISVVWNTEHHHVCFPKLLSFVSSTENDDVIRLQLSFQRPLFKACSSTCTQKRGFVVWTRKSEDSRALGFF